MLAAVEDDPEKKPHPRDDREVDYLMCSQCGTPCYVFEIEDGRVLEAQCLTCGNDEVSLFNIGEQEEEGE